MRILLAPDKFKGTLDAPAVAAAMARGVRDVLPGADASVHPLADGGEGTLACIAAATEGRLAEVDAEDAVGGPVRAHVYATGRAAMIAMHETALLGSRPTVVAALRSSSRGTGLALARAHALFPGKEIVVWVGGSASTDGGAGAAQAVGWRLLDALGRDLPPGGGALRKLARIAAPDERVAATVTGACDVSNPLLGERGAAPVFAPQKGAGPDEVRLLEEGLGRLTERIQADLGVDVSQMAHGGAGGGMGAGLAAFFGASLVDGFDRVAVETGLAEALGRADLVVTGEGRIDTGSLDGKVTSNLARLCAARDTPCLVVAGEVDLPLALHPAEKALGAAGVASLVETCGRKAAFDAPARCVTETTARLLARHLPG